VETGLGEPGPDRGRPALGVAGPGPPGPALELETEWSLIGGIAEARRRVAAERAKGCRIIFISDMYLPADFLRRCLTRHGFWAEGDSLYVSSETGQTKFSGNLFRHVLAAEKIAPAELRHFGDHPWADFAVPRQLGIQADLFTSAAPRPIESLLLRHRPAAGQARVDTAGRLRFARLTTGPAAPGGDRAAGDFVEAFLGPLLCLFGHWLLDRAQAGGIDRLFFVARDARLAWSVCRVLAAQRQERVDCRYLYLSRQAIYLPSVTEVSPAGMPWLREGNGLRTLPQIAAKLDLGPEELAAAWARSHPAWPHDRELSLAADWEGLWTLLRSRPFAERILAAAATRRGAALEYFAQAGLLQAAAPAIVDLGSLLNCQEALQRVCTGRRGATPLRGYYLYLKRGHRGPAEAGPAEAVFREGAADLAEPDSFSWIHRTGAIEHIVGLADHPSVRGYAAGGTATFVPVAPAVEPARFQALEAALLGYVETFGECWKAIAADPDGAGTMGTLLQDFIASPPAAALEFLRGVTFPADQGHGELHPLVEPFTWGEVARGLLPPRRGRPAVERLWPEAALRTTPPLRRHALGAAGRVARACRYFQSQ